MRNRRVLLIGLDAGDPLLVERWTEEGVLPNLARLKAAGAYGRLQSSARYLSGSPWPTFYTGRPPSSHGIYHDFQWRHEHMGYARPSWDWLPNIPFWRQLEDEVRVVAYDVPMALGCQSASGIEITGWAGHDSLTAARSHPPDLLDQIRAKFGEWPMEAEGYGRSSPSELLDLRRRLLQDIDRSKELAKWLLERDWDLGLVVFGALHRGGHRLWDRSSLRGSLDGQDGAAFDGALRDLYQACDRAVGELVAASPDATVMVFSVHGMMANTSRSDLLDGMLTRVLRGRDAELPKPGRMRRLGEALPLGFRRRLTRALPLPVQAFLMTRWTAGGIDWSNTPAFTLRADLQGYVRINLAGREAEGIVSSAAYGELCERLEQGLRSFRDAQTGEPFLTDVRRASDVFMDADRTTRLPDLLVLWDETPAASHSAVESERYGRVERSTPGRIPNARSGNHRPEGFLVAQGDGISAGSRIRADAHILDLAPTILDLLGTRAATPLAGRPLSL